MSSALSSTSLAERLLQGAFHLLLTQVALQLVDLYLAQTEYLELTLPGFLEFRALTDSLLSGTPSYPCLERIFILYR